LFLEIHDTHEMKLLLQQFSKVMTD